MYIMHLFNYHTLRHGVIIVFQYLKLFPCLIKPGLIRVHCWSGSILWDLWRLVTSRVTFLIPRRPSLRYMLTGPPAELSFSEAVPSCKISNRSIDGHNTNEGQSVR
jgi:hypothetical protein